MKDVNIWVYIDEEGVIRPLSFILVRKDTIYEQEDIEAFMKKMKGQGKVVKAKIIVDEIIWKV